MMDILSTAGNSSLEINRSSKGEYSYSLKLYFSGTTIAAMKTIIDRIIVVKEYMENKLGITSEVQDI